LHIVQLTYTPLSWHLSFYLPASLLWPPLGGQLAIGRLGWNPGLPAHMHDRHQASRCRCPQPTRHYALSVLNDKLSLLVTKTAGLERGLIKHDAARLPSHGILAVGIKGFPGDVRKLVRMMEPCGML
jgi:hypothetical protein